jgi:hypothetical protein
MEVGVSDYELDTMLKGQQWERAKGELRALVSMQGSYKSTAGNYRSERWEELNAKVHAFIKEVEDDALQE